MSWQNRGTAKSDSVRPRRSNEKDDSHWSFGLLKTLKDPKMICFEDDLTTAIKDQYPKARHHYLVCPKETIPSLHHLKRQHLDLLQHMQRVGEKLTGLHESSNFLLGYHSLPSMFQLHLHVISDDFDSPHLKNRRHWNTFTTSYFLPSSEVIREIEENGQVSRITNAQKVAYIKRQLKCHKCDYKPENIPQLKLHLKEHLNS